MSDMLQALLNAGAIQTSSFAPNSRYANLPLKQLTRTDGTSLSYLSRRFVPDPVRFATLQFYQVREGDRADSIAARTLGDPLLWWRLADANGVIDPSELTRTLGEKLRITAQKDLPGSASGGV